MPIPANMVRLLPCTLLVMATAAFADEEDDPKATTPLSVADGAIREVLGYRASAKALKDIIKLNCVNDKLQQLKSHREGLAAAVARREAAGSRAATDQEDARIGILEQKIRVLSTEARNCVGDDLTYLGPVSFGEEPARNCPDCCGLNLIHDRRESVPPHAWSQGPAVVPLLISFRDDVHSSWRPAALSVWLDGASIYHSTNDAALRAAHPLVVRDGKLPAGAHELRLQVRYHGNGHGVFTYMDQSVYEITSMYDFELASGGPASVEIDAVRTRHIDLQYRIGGGLRGRESFSYETQLVACPKTPE